MPAALASLERLQALFDQLIAELVLHPVAKPVWHQFPDTGGITGFALLSESHLACHTFPEYGSLCLNVFCCRQRDDWRFREYLMSEFAATSVGVRRIHRSYRSE
jgi:S-adenosylmethionine decarboxylase